MDRECVCASEKGDAPGSAEGSDASVTCSDARGLSSQAVRDIPRVVRRGAAATAPGQGRVHGA
eukprot:1107908-Rhodomonas_salina.4